MKAMTRFFTVIAVTTIFTTTLALDGFAQRPVLRKGTATRASGQQSVAAGKKIRVRINQNLSSKVSQVGDRFTTITIDPVYASNGQCDPAGF